MEFFRPHSVDCCTISPSELSFYFCCNQSSANCAVLISSKKTDDIRTSPFVTAVMIKKYISEHENNFLRRLLGRKEHCRLCAWFGLSLRRSCNTAYEKSFPWRRLSATSFPSYKKIHIKLCRKETVTNAPLWRAFHSYGWLTVFPLYAEKRLIVAPVRLEVRTKCASHLEPGKY